MTDLLFQTDSYVKEFQATVTAVNPDEGAVALDRTAFYPGGGGQPNDVGHLLLGGRSLPVSKVKRQGEDVWHWLAGELPAAGTAVTGHLDWERRYKLMRTHTALHILCGMMFRDYGVSVTGGDMEPLAARMDFELEHMSADFAQQVEQKVNAEVAAAPRAKPPCGTAGSSPTSQCHTASSWRLTLLTGSDRPPASRWPRSFGWPPPPG